MYKHCEVIAKTFPAFPLLHVHIRGPLYGVPVVTRVKGASCLEGKTRERRPGWQANACCLPKRTVSQHVLCHGKESGSLLAVLAESSGQTLCVMLS